MTQDAQHDRSASPLAPIPDAIHAPARPQIPDPAGEDAVSTTETETPSTFDSESFEGFGSFS